MRAKTRDRILKAGRMLRAVRTPVRTRMDKVIAATTVRESRIAVPRKDADLRAIKAVKNQESHASLVNHARIVARRKTVRPKRDVDLRNRAN
jgi:pyruvate/2-oxoacid:ferredoxin oxidoreductase alpha subunit